MGLTDAERAKLRLELVYDEGLRLKPYHDSTGHLTIGVGRNLTDRGITHAEAEMMLDHDIAEVETQLAFLLPWASKLDPVRYQAVCNMTFNLGIDGLLRFVMFLESLKHGEYRRASEHMLDSKWASLVGERARRLAKMIRSGEAA